MCATCVAQGVFYVGGAVGGLRVMAFRAKVKRLAGEAAKTAEPAEPGEPRPDDLVRSDG
jgi:hypothetical protein